MSKMAIFGLMLLMHINYTSLYDCYIETYLYHHYTALH